MYLKVYKIKNDLAKKFIKDIKDGKLDGNYKWGYDNIKKMPTLNIQIGKVKGSFHIQQKLKKKIKRTIGL